MEDRFGACLAFTRKEEGDYVADARDPGNWSGGRVGYGQLIGSNMGVGAAALQAWMGPGCRLSPAVMRDLPRSTYEAIALENYWKPLGCGALPAGLDLMAFDFGWNRGVPQSVSLLRTCYQDYTSEQRTCLPFWRTLLLGLPTADIALVQRHLRVRDDGVAGPVTLAALDSRPNAAPWIAVLAFYAAQVASYKRLHSFAIYGGGWLARTARRRTEALAALPD